MSANEPLVLGIETSCDETGIGIVRGKSLLANEIASSVAEQARYGGVVPEVAARAHLEAFFPTLDRALATARVQLKDFDAIAVTRGPGLAGPLLVGTGGATGLAAGLGIPTYGVNHLAAHIAISTVILNNSVPHLMMQLVKHSTKSHEYWDCHFLADHTLID